MANDNKVEDHDLPALFLTADKASRMARRKSTILTAVNLLLLLTAAILGAITLANSSDQRYLIYPSIAILAAAVFVSRAIRSLNLEQQWYNGRAIAESVKSLAWRYMAHCEPYLHKKDPEADQLLTDDLKQLMAQRKDFCLGVTMMLAQAPQITDRMRVVRQLATLERTKTYLSQRIDDQIRWYSSQAERNRKWEDVASTAMILSELLAVVGAIIMAVWPGSHFNPVGLLVDLTLVIISWMEFQRYRELAQSYAFAAEEIGLAKEKARYVKTDEELSEFVIESEKAIATEHKLWLARRDQR
jgi:hypothetical protein